MGQTEDVQTPDNTCQWIMHNTNKQFLLLSIKYKTGNLSLGAEVRAAAKALPCDKPGI